MAAGHPVSEHQREGVIALAALVDRGGELGGPRRAIGGTAEALVARAGALIIQTVVEGNAESLKFLLPDILRSLLAPYVGLEEAERLTRE